MSEPMGAPDKFKIGDRVRLSAKGRKQFRYQSWASEDRRGTVVGWSSQRADCVRIVRDGVKTKERFQMDFWEKAE